MQCGSDGDDDVGPSLRHPKKGGTPGLGLLPQLKVIPHFDMFTKRMPDVAARFLLPFDESATVIGIDEDTAIIGGPDAMPFVANSPRGS